jgi:hypothetical protein
VYICVYMMLNMGFWRSLIKSSNNKYASCSIKETRVQLCFLRSHWLRQTDVLHSATRCAPHIILLRQ